MNKIINFFLESNHWKHVVGGVLVYFAMLPVAACYAALAAVVLVASSLELKDMLYGNRWDWVDWACTVTIPAVVCVMELILR